MAYKSRLLTLSNQPDAAYEANLIKVEVLRLEALPVHPRLHSAFTAPFSPSHPSTLLLGRWPGWRRGKNTTTSASPPPPSG